MDDDEFDVLVLMATQLLDRPNSIDRQPDQFSELQLRSSIAKSVRQKLIRGAAVQPSAQAWFEVVMRVAGKTRALWSQSPVGHPGQLAVPDDPRRGMPA